MRIQGLIIDPQEDFCNPETGSLYVPGADLDMVRLAEMVERLGTRAEQIHVTLDSHHTLDIAHPAWWRSPEGQEPAPFTIITSQDLAIGAWTTADPASFDRSRSYVDSLAANGRYPLCIWPYHCRIGSAGQAVASRLFEALTAWEKKSRTGVDYIRKGENIWTEHYSVIRADVPDPSDPSTEANTLLLAQLSTADLVFVAGEAGSHCVANTVRDIAALAGDALLRKLVLILDAVSPVTGFEGLQGSFLEEMTARGMRTARSAEFLS